jgi:hypothetical protein
MQQSKASPQDPASCGQALAAIGILLFLAITVPILGVLMIPVVALIPVARALRNVQLPRAGIGSALASRLRRPARPFAASAIGGR